MEAIPRTNNWGNCPGVRCARANTAPLITAASGVGTLQGKMEKLERQWSIKSHVDNRHACVYMNQPQVIKS